MRYHEFKMVEDIINEINMSPKSLEKLSNNIDAKVGIEFEFVYSNSQDDEYVDKDDEEVYNIRSVMNFFSSGDIELDDDSILDELDEKLTEEYNEWADSQKEKFMTRSEFDEDKLNILRGYFYRGGSNLDADVELANRITEIKGYDKDSDEFRKIYRWHSSMSDGQRRLLSNESLLAQVNKTSNSDEIGLKDYYEIRKPIYDRVDKIINDFLSGKKIPQKLSLQNFLDNEIAKKYASERQFFRTHYANMSDIHSAFSDEFSGLYWPQERKEYDVDDILEEFKNAVGPNYTASTDSSIRTEGYGNDVAVEIKTDGALPLAQALAELAKAQDFIETHGYTNDSTGLHINVSVPNFNRNHMDYVKLVLLSGDEYILKQFDRESNTYAESSLQKIKSKIDDTDITDSLESLQDHLETLAGQILHNGWTDKYVSINVHNNRVEFRGPGGRWAEEQNIGFMIDTVRRMVVALDASLDETKYKKEYAKKLYKFLKPYSNYDDILKLFAMYNSKSIPKAALKSWIKKHKRNRPDVIKGDKIYWIFGAKDLSYVWGSGQTKSDALEDSRQEIQEILDSFPPDSNEATLWNREIRNCTFLPTNRETHEKIQNNGTISLTRTANGIYVEE